MKGVTLTPLTVIPNAKGDLLKAMTATDNDYLGFGEAYFSSINFQSIKGWTKHSRMQINLVVPQGSVQFVIYDSFEFESVNLSLDNYCRLTVEPGLWVAFRGCSSPASLILNIANMVHDDAEEDKQPLSAFPFDWGVDRCQ